MAAVLSTRRRAASSDGLVASEYSCRLDEAFKVNAKTLRVAHSDDLFLASVELVLGYEPACLLRIFEFQATPV